MIECHVVLIKQVASSHALKEKMSNVFILSKYWVMCHIRDLTCNMVLPGCPTYWSTEAGVEEALPGLPE